MATKSLKQSGAAAFSKKIAKEASGSKSSRTRSAAYEVRAGILGLKGMPAVELIEKISAGFPYRMVDAFRESTDLPMDAIAELVQVPSRTLSRRKQERRLHPDESERLLRAARVIDKAVDLFEGDRPAAMRWLKAPLPALSGQTPLEFSRSDVGAREVEDLIGRLEHGVFS